MITPGRVWLAAAIALDLATVVCTIGQIAALAQVMEPVVIESRGLDAIVAPALVLVALTLARSACVGAREIVGMRAALRVRTSARRAVLDQLVARGPCGLADESRGEVLALLGQGLERLDAWVARYWPQRTMTVLGPLAVAGYVLRLDPPSGIVLLISAPVIPLLMVAVGSFTRERTAAQWTALTRLNAALLDSIQGLPTLKLFGREGDEAKRLAVRGETVRGATMHVLRAAFVSGFVLELMTTAAIALVAVETGLRLLDGGISFIATLQVVLLAPEFYRPIRELGAHRHAALEAEPVLERLDALLAAPATVEVRGPAASRVEPTTCAALELVDVSYTYPNADAPALSHISLVLPRGTRTALVGPSGAGKTTLLNLLLRFLEPDSGAIFSEGEPIQARPAETWRQRMAFVPQHPYLFDASAAENLRLARPDATLSELMYAAELAGAHSFLRDLSNGYDTPLGVRGAHLSRGQVQRIALARAFLKDAPILVLDEPVTALDPESERLIRASFHLLAERRTVLTVAHHMSSVVDSDQVVFLQQGCIAEAGTHHELLASSGPYARMLGARVAV